MNTKVLSYLLTERQELIESRLQGTAYDSRATIGVAKILAANGGKTSSLSAAQLYHYETFLKPLLHVYCEGPVGFVGPDSEASSCVGSGVIDDETLLLCYQEDDFLCQSCRHDRSRFDAN
ncbi:hypothetical protein [Aquimonas voraii]|uniref:hypothetical protein n=1 Tax=Aquimonas voraii TaxID=265719 RepID=UPI00115FDE88|nr:hypothetical protein [Aquimonas voraii]